MSMEIIKELTKVDENEIVASEQVMTWARRVEAQKARSAILENLQETKDFDRIFTRNRAKTQDRMQLQEQTQMPARQRCRYCGSIHPPRW